MDWIARIIMANRKCEIYGPDLKEHEEEGKAIANMGLKCMKGTGATNEQAGASGPDTSRNSLENLK